MEAGQETSGQSNGGIKREGYTMAAKVQYSRGTILLINNCTAGLSMVYLNY